MRRLKSRSTKIQPCSDNGVGSAFAKVMPNLAVFGRTNSVATSSCRSHPNLKLDSNKASYKILSRMDDPEEVFELSSAPSGLIRHSVSLPICNTLQVTPGRFASCRSSVDFSRLHTSSDLMVKPQQQQANEHRAGVARTEKIFEKCDVWSKMETRVSEDSYPTSSADNTIDTRNEKPWQKSQKLTHSEIISTANHSDIVEWTANPEKCYLCILSFKQEKASDSRASLKNRTNHQPIVLDDLEDYQLVSYSPEVLVFSAVEHNLPGELENTLANSNIDLNFCYNSKKLTPLHLAAHLGFTQCVQVLLKHGSNVNCLNSKNHSPLYMAFAEKHYECAILLIEAGADIQQFTAQKVNEFRTARNISQTYKRTFVSDV